MQNKRLSILTATEIDELYAPPVLSPTQKQHFFSLNPAELKIFEQHQSRHLQAHFVLLLGYFKAKAIPIDITLSAAQQDLAFIYSQYFPGRKPTRLLLSKQQKSRLYAYVFQLTGYSPFSQQHQLAMSDHACDSARIWVEPRYIFDECLDYLAAHKITVPSYSTLQKAVASTLTKTRGRWEQSLKTHRSTTLTQHIEQIIAAVEPVSLLTSLKTLPKDFSLKELDKEIASFQFLHACYPEVVELVDRLQLSNKNSEYFASLVDYYTITKLRRFDFETAALYVMCFIRQRYRQINDNLVNAFIYHARHLTQEGKSHAQTVAYECLKEIDAKAKKASGLLRLYVDDSIAGTTPFSTVRKRAYTIIPQRDIAQVSDYLAEIAIDETAYEWAFYDKHTVRIRRSLRAIFQCLQFSTREDHAHLRRQIRQSQQDLLLRSRLVHCDKRLIAQALKPYVLQSVAGSVTTHKADSKIIQTTRTVNANRFEFMLYQRMKEAIESGDLFIPDSHQFLRLEEDLLNDAQWQHKDTLIEQANLPNLRQPVEALLNELEQRLDNKLTEVSQRIANGNNAVVVRTLTTGKTRWQIPYVGVESLFNNPYFGQVPPVHIGALLTFVHRETDYLSAFNHIQPYYQKSEADLNNLIACIVANGTNFGLHKMAKISDRTLDQLRTSQANFLRPETLHEGCDIITNAIAQLPIFPYFNIQQDRVHASSDGQKFECRLNSFKARYSSKYFGKHKGVSSFTLVANHVPINAKLIGANEHESHHVFDLLYNNSSEIRPDVLSTDTHGTNQVNYAILDCFGYTFAPRYASVGKVLSELFSVSTDTNTRLLHLKKPIRRSIIVDEWDTVQRIMISLQQKKSTQATIVRKLSSYSSNNRILQALVEYDRIIKCLYLLDYMDDASLRRYVQRALNRGEAYHQLRRAVASVNGNRFRGGSDQEILLWNECARLITIGIIYFNALILSKLLVHYETLGDAINLALIKKVSPVAWINVNLNGTYSFAFDEASLDMTVLLKDLMQVKRAA